MSESIEWPHVTLAEFTRRLGLADDQQRAVCAWSNLSWEDWADGISEGKADELAEMWESTRPQAT